MSSKTIIVTLAILVTALYLNFSEACDETLTRPGCKIDGRQCICGIGCYSEYRYNNKEECRRALKARRHNVCLENPCRNDGTCIQVNSDSGYRCRCEGTGFYGNRCQMACPSGINGRNMGVFPHECIVI